MIQPAGQGEGRPGRASAAPPPGGRRSWSRVRYPIQAAGRAMRSACGSRRAGHGAARRGGHRPAQRRPAAPAGAPPRLHLRPRDRPEAARSPAAVEAAWREGRAPRVTVEAQGGIDIDGDGKADIGSKGIAGGAFRAARGPRGTAPAAPGPAREAVLRLVPDRPDRSRANRARSPSPPATGRCAGASPAGASAGTVHLGPGDARYTAPDTPGTQTIRLSHGTAVVKVVNALVDDRRARRPRPPPPARSSARWATRSPPASATTATAR